MEQCSENASSGMRGAKVIRKCTFICFIGIDGSGKTTQALSLHEYFKEKGLNSIYMWSRRKPYFLKIPVSLMKRYILKEREKSDGSAYLSIKRKRKNLFSNRLFIFLWINLSLLEYFLFIYFKILRSNRNKDVLICDRYLYDAIVDFALSSSIPVSKIGSLCNNFISSLFPKPDRLYFIDIDADVGANRKKDGTSLAYLEDRVPLYRHVAKLTDAVVIDGTLPLHEIREIIYKDAANYLAENKNSNPFIFQYS